uniref:Carboxylic ester hydrolase n=1 Tax=Leptinotarsa decemlineata TaxID=7539 RepID=A0A0A7EQC4_LEPDE|nr:esterase [Leptinotarsa decemlineata]
MLKLSVFLYFALYEVSSEDPIITISNGKIRGISAHSSLNNLTYYAYMGIPFATPPVGNLRFKPPQPVENWDGILDTKNNEVTCYQTDRYDKHETEDCLYLNVYTTVGPMNNTKLPVIMFIYGGTFVHGHAPYGHKDPVFVIEKGVLMVTFNYRVGPFGFLSTGDTVIPGNMGLKDQQLALKWVQKNIQFFGGDPDKVTLMGQSAGAASVTYQILSPGSRGLFRAAIANSGSALCTWAHQRNAVETAYGIAAEIDPSFSRNRSSADLLEFLLSVDAESISKTCDKFTVFAPVIEEPHEGAIISDVMYETVEKGDINRVPLLIGINSEEEINKAANIDSLISKSVKYDEDPKLIVDDDMYIEDGDEKLAIGESIRGIYTNGLFQDDIGKTVQYSSDNRFTKAVIKFAELQSHYTDVYFYQFSYHGLMENNTVSLDGVGKVAHAEDQKYFWARYDDYQEFPRSDMMTLDRYVTLLTNFAKCLNPTPEKRDLFDNVLWPKVSKDVYYYLDIDTNITVQHNPRNTSYYKWVDIFEKYVPKPFISF